MMAADWSEALANAHANLTIRAFEVASEALILFGPEFAVFLMSEAAKRAVEADKEKPA